MRREFRERFHRHRLQKKPRVSDPGMQHGTCVMDPVKASVVPLPAKTEAESYSHSSIWHYISPHNEVIKPSSSVPSHSNTQLTQRGNVSARQLAGREVTRTWNEQQKLPRQKNDEKVWKCPGSSHLCITKLQDLGRTTCFWRSLLCDIWA